MADTLISLGLDVGTTSTQLVFSRLTIENRSGSFSVPELEIADREILYRSPIHFTPLLSGELVDGARIRDIVQAEYEKAGIRPEDVDTGAIIITGERPCSAAFVNQQTACPASCPMPVPLA